MRLIMRGYGIWVRCIRGGERNENGASNYTVSCAIDAVYRDGRKQKFECRNEIFTPQITPFDNESREVFFSYF